MVAGQELLYGLVPAFRERLEWGLSYLDAYSISTRVTSGKRSRKRQAELYAAFKAGKGNPADPPGSSVHEFGMGADITPDRGSDYQYLHAVWRYLGLAVPYPREPWHVEVPNWRRYAGV